MHFAKGDTVYNLYSEHALAYSFCKTSVKRAHCGNHDGFINANYFSYERVRHRGFGDRVNIFMDS